MTTYVARIVRWMNAPECKDCHEKIYCKKCGSYNVKSEGFPDWNHRHRCLVCGNVMAVSIR